MAQAWTLPSDAEIAGILAERIEGQGLGVGMVAGVIDASGPRIVAHGVASRRDGRPLDGDTVFEIGSVTKVFTALLLSEMARRGEVALDEPVQALLPHRVVAPERGGRQITLQHLAQHTSGLPRQPTNMSPADRTNPYTDYTVEDLYAFLRGHQLRQDIGAVREYSNLGSGLLGHALALRAGVSFEALVRERVTGPLGMGDTGITLSDAMLERRADGHDQQGEVVGAWDIGSLAGAGGLRSTANDMLRFLAAQIGMSGGPAAAATLLGPRFPIETGGEQALGWVVMQTEVGEVALHDGGTGGFCTVAGINLERGIGAVLLSNQQTVRPGNDILLHLLGGKALQPPPARYTAINLSPDELAAFVGRYAFADVGGISIYLQGDALFARMPGWAALELLPYESASFFMTRFDAQVLFEVDGQGEVTGLIARQNGLDRLARRVN